MILNIGNLKGEAVIGEPVRPVKRGDAEDGFLAVLDKAATGLNEAGQRAILEEDDSEETLPGGEVEQPDSSPSKVTVGLGGVLIGNKPGARQLAGEAANLGLGGSRARSGLGGLPQASQAPQAPQGPQAPQTKAQESGSDSAPLRADRASSPREWAGGANNLDLKSAAVDADAEPVDRPQLLRSVQSRQSGIVPQGMEPARLAATGVAAKPDALAADSGGPSTNNLAPTSQSLLQAVRDNSSWQAAQVSATSAFTQKEDLKGGILKQLKVQLNPIELGRLDLNLKMQEGLMRVVVRTETEAAYQHLTADHESILKSMRAIGIKVDHVLIEGPRDHSESALADANDRTSQRDAQSKESGADAGKEGTSNASHNDDNQRHGDGSVAPGNGTDGDHAAGRYYF